jgi:magnesium transporter
MLIGYTIAKNKSVTKAVLTPKNRSKIRDSVWIDVLQPSPQEKIWLKKRYGIHLPSSAEVDKIEVMTPFYKEKDVYYMTCTIVDQTHTSTPITFILTPQCIFTLRYEDSQNMRNFARYSIQNPNLLCAPHAVFTALIEMIINKIGDILDTTGSELDDLIQSVLEQPPENVGRKSQNYNNVIRSIGYTGNLISKNRESLASINRALMYFGQIEDAQYINKREQRSKLKHLGREISSMTEYAAFLAQRNYFLLDGTLGMISVEQNIIIKIFTIAAVVFMPPTLIASIYGMNFDFMPELHSTWGYPVALGVMISSAILPYFFFKRKGWI